MNESHFEGALARLSAAAQDILTEMLQHQARRPIAKASGFGSTAKGRSFDVLRKMSDRIRKAGWYSSRSKSSPIQRQEGEQTIIECKANYYNWPEAQAAIAAFAWPPESEGMLFKQFVVVKRGKGRRTQALVNSNR